MWDSGSPKGVRFRGLWGFWESQGWWSLGIPGVKALGFWSFWWSQAWRLWRFQGCVLGVPGVESQVVPTDLEAVGGGEQVVTE